MTTRSLPLNGFKVLDLTAHRAGPTAVRQLADWGADVIKIEEPGGPDVDATGSRRNGPDFQNLHRNKRSLTLNLKSPEGKKIFFEMAKTADVVVENFRSTVKHRLGVDYESVKKINPRIVYGSISGFGQDGPYEGRPGVDQIAQGMGGLMSITGHAGGGPVRVGIAINDTSSGLLLANGIVLALLDRERTGEGQWVYTSLIEAQIYMLDFQAARSKNRKALNALVVDVVRKHPNAYWLDAMDKAGVPCGPINTVDKVFADPQVQHLGIAKPIDHPKYGPQKVVGQPIHMSRYPQPDKLMHTPEPGEHTDEVLKDLGYDAAAIAALRAKGAV